ncbi:hypothetical protein CP10139811_1414 [Chlamydia ibidis]|uniref:Uncharacterized protein n=1 Tax=Chlamydia ibidis TaxID=1405396 RepID=S7KLB9_9CHLA|nr:hypothetical protein CP8484711_2973 [Chlamydia psittaci 84-8471/1]EPP35215.1 hypothetical protein CP10139811_1414 [Chlamydia ibidis]
MTCFLNTNPPFMQKTRVFFSQITHLCENHIFSLRILHLTCK